MKSIPAHGAAAAGPTSAEEDGRRSRAKLQTDLLMRAAASRQPALGRAVRGLPALSASLDDEEPLDVSVSREMRPDATRLPAGMPPNVDDDDGDGSKRIAGGAATSASARSDVDRAAAAFEARVRQASFAGGWSPASLGTGTVTSAGRVNRCSPQQSVGREPRAFGAKTMALIGWGVALALVVVLAASLAALAWPAHEREDDPPKEAACQAGDGNCYR